MKGVSRGFPLLLSPPRGGWMVGISGEGKPASKRRLHRRKKEVALNFYCSALAIARGPCQRAGGVLDHSPSRACRGARL